MATKQPTKEWLTLKPIMANDLFSLKRQFLRATRAYYNSDKPIMSDAAFDNLEDRIKKLDPDWKQLHKTGTKVANKKTERELFKFMPSLDKKYPEQLATYYKRKAVKETLTWIQMDKLDGTSLQLRCYKRKPTHLITRGDGTLGGDVSFLLPALIAAGRIPKQIDDPGEVVFRLEGIMKKRVFDKRWSRSVMGKRGFDNIRNGVNGLFNRMDSHPALSDIELVVLGVYGMSLNSGLKAAAGWGFTTVRHTFERRAPDHIVQASILERRRKDSDYEMDGLVIAPASMILEYKNADKPKAMIAFKVNDISGAADVKVLDIIWQKTRLKRWIPKILIEPTYMDGVMVEHATLHNATWMTERGIGVGAILKVLRSGGVIPKVVGVVKKAKKPSVPPGPYAVKGVHFVMTKHDKMSTIRTIHHFMTTLGIETIALSTLGKMYEQGFDSIGKYVSLAVLARTRDGAAASAFSRAGLGQIEGHKKLRELCRVLNAPVPLKKLMVASGCFDSGGVGERKLTQIEDCGLTMRSMLLLKEDVLYRKLMGMHGFKDLSANKIIEGVNKVYPWLQKIEKHIVIDKTPPKKQQQSTRNGPLNGVNVSWTTYRDKGEEAKVETFGGTVVSFGAKTTVLLYNPDGKASTKVEKAGDKAMTWDQFMRKYKLKPGARAHV